MEVASRRAAKHRDERRLREPRGHDDRLRTEPPGLQATHRRPHTARPGLVAGRQHDPGSDDDRATAEPRIIALLDRGVEGVQVGVQDRGLARHEHMFASGLDATVRAPHRMTRPSARAWTKLVGACACCEDGTPEPDPGGGSRWPTYPRPRKGSR